MLRPCELFLAQKRLNDDAQHSQLAVSPFLCRYWHHHPHSRLDRSYQDCSGQTAPGIVRLDQIQNEWNQDWNRHRRQIMALGINYARVALFTFRNVHLCVSSIGLTFYGFFIASTHFFRHLAWHAGWSHLTKLQLLVPLRAIRSFCFFYFCYSNYSHSHLKKSRSSPN